MIINLKAVFLLLYFVKWVRRGGARYKRSLKHLVVDLEYLREKICRDMRIGSHFRLETSRCGSGMSKSRAVFRRVLEGEIKHASMHIIGSHFWLE